MKMDQPEAVDVAPKLSRLRCILIVLILLRPCIQYGFGIRGVVPFLYEMYTAVMAVVAVLCVFEVLDHLIEAVANTGYRGKTRTGKDPAAEIRGDPENF